MGVYPWFKRRRYKHFDVPVGLSFAAKAMDPRFVARHSWSPLISCSLSTKRYKVDLGKTITKIRPIAYASHRDACILSKYANDLSWRLEEAYRAAGLGGTVLAYRSLGLSNYDFAAVAHAFARSLNPCVVYCFDVSGFFDHLDHRILKQKLRDLLGVKELPEDWFKVFKNVTCYHHVSLENLKAHPVFGLRRKSKATAPLATIVELKAAGISIEAHSHSHGIPQGTPISAALSNLYMIDLDRSLSKACIAKSALYQRYSDDLILICKPEHEAELVATIRHEVKLLALDLNDAKEDRVPIAGGMKEFFQYLGFEMSLDDAHIRSSSLSRQWRKARRALRKARLVGAEAIAAGHAKKIYTKKLRKRFSSVPVRNFSSYARRSAKVLGSKAILYQVRKLERMIDHEIRSLN